MMSRHNPLSTYIYRKLLPQLWQDRIDVVRGESQVFRPCFQETKSIFIHIPKAAGTSIARAIYYQNVGHRKASDYIRVSKREYNQYYRFSFTRNPWDRLVSAYNFVKQGGTDLVQPLPNPAYQSSVFADFKTFVIEWLPYADLSKEDVVFEPQFEYIYDSAGNLQVDFVGRVENTAKDIAIIEQNLGIKIELNTLNSSNRQGRDYRREYTDAMLEIVHNVYRKDIELFDYQL